MRFISGAVLMMALWAGTVQAASPTYLRSGSSGPKVQLLQQYLHMNKQQDFYGGNLDGAFGPITRSGLWRWQTAIGQPATGRITVGSQQWSRLQQEATV